MTPQDTGHVARHARFKLFSVVFGIAYTICFYMNSVDALSPWWAPFRYYPAIETWSIARLDPETAGPAILWYAWLAEACAFSVVLSLLVPRKLADRVTHTMVWSIPAALLFAILVYERRWFF